MTRRVLLVEIGTPAELPVVTPPAPRPPSNWVPDPRPSPGLPPPTGLAVVSIADAAVLSWTPSVAGGQTIIDAAADVAGVPGIWREVDRSGADTYTLSLPGGARWARVRAELNGRTSVATNAVLAEPIDVGGSISEFEQELRDIADLVDTVAAQAAAEAAALNARADALRDDVDATIAEVSTLADLTEDLGTEITRVETESVARDTATVETISLLGAKNAAGNAFILNGNTLRVSPTETLAQWRSSIQGEFGAQSSRIDNEVQARQDGDQALATTLATVQATANNAATKAELTSAQNALASADQALAEDIRVLDVAVGDTRNLVKNPTPRTTVDPWTGNNGVSSIQRVTGWLHPTEDRVLRINFTGGTSTATAYEPEFHPVVADEVIVASMDARTTGFAGGDFYTLGCWFRDENGVQIGSSRQYSIGDISASAVWRTYQGRITVPAGAVEFRVAVSAANPPAGSAILAARISARRQSADGAIISSIVDIARADIQENADDIAAAVQRISSAETAIDGKASASDLAATQLTVTQQGNTLTAHGQTLNGLTATVGDHSASINEQREVSAQLLDGSVSINDPGFERQEWGGGTSGTGALADGVTFNTASANQRNGNVSLRFGGVPGSGQRIVYSQRKMRVTPGQKIRFTLQSRSGAPMVSGDYVRLGGRLYEEGNPNGVNQSFFNVQRTSTGTSWGYSNGEASGIFTVPDRVVELRPYVVAVVTDSQSIIVDDLQAEPVGTDLASVLASYVLAMNAGGKFSGVKYLNDGSVSNATFLFDNFDFETADGTFRISDGRMINRSGGYMEVRGKPFGQGSEFMAWYGPEQSNLNNCRRNNAIFYRTISGESFQRGGIIAGTRVHSGFNPGLAVPSIYTTPALGTGGNPIAVNASVSYFQQVRASAIGAVIVPGGGANTATIQLWRRVGSGGWQMVDSRTVTGTLQIIDESDGYAVALWNINGAITYTDTTGGSQNRVFEVRLVARSVQGVSTQNPAHQIILMSEQQSVGIVTEEDP